MSRAGFVLVGGQSSRMGRDKAVLPHRDATLVERVAREVLAAAGSVTLVGPAERYQALGYSVISDRLAGCGPLAGIEAALRATRADWNLVVACDMPAVTAAFLNSLWEAAEHSGADCLLPVSGPGRPEPLCAVYHRRCLPRIAKALDEGTRKITDALAGLHVVFWPAGNAACFDNVNTPEDWEAYRKALA
jgi:molybdopterin-guanine dinucleotide biosynthesis protein A